MSWFLTDIFKKNKNSEVKTSWDKKEEKTVPVTGVTLLSDGKLTDKKEDKKMEDKGAPAETIVSAKQYKNLVVVLDTGHAKTTAGKKSPYSLKKVTSPELPLEEWQLSRDIANRLKPMLERYGIEVYLTTDTERDGDSDLGLSKRAERGNNYVKKSGKKGVFISIHADADGMGDKWTKAHGWSCYTTVGQNNSDKLADCLYDAAEEILPKYNLTIRTDKTDGDRDKEKDFTVIFKSNMPAVLTENLFYTNIEDCKFLISEEGKNEIAKIHLNGILKFAEKVYKM